MSVVEIAAADYHEDRVADTPTLSASIARVLCTHTPAHAREQHPRLNPNYKRTVDGKFDIGIYAHDLLLEGVENVHIVAADSWRSKAAQEERDEARAAGRVPLLHSQWDEVRAMVDAVRAQLPLFDADPPVFTAGKPEQAIVWDEDGIKCRARLDWLHDDHTAVDDLKTTGKSADPFKWGQHTLFGMGYDVQAAFYRRAVRAAFGAETDFRFVVVEVTPPFLCSVVTLDADAWEFAESKVDYALAVWRRCLERDRWDGYDRRTAFVNVPGWAASAWAEREALLEAA